MAVEFSNENLERFNDILTRYPTKRAASLPTLHMAQRQFGHISREVVEYVAGLLELTSAEIDSVVTFYTMFYRKAMGKYVIQVCHTLSCAIMGAPSVVDHIEDKLRIKHGETTEDGKFSLIKVECLGSCGTAPVIQINDDYYESLTLEKVDQILDNLS